MDKKMATLVIGIVSDQQARGATVIRWVGLKIGFGFVLGLGTEVQTILLGEFSQNLPHTRLFANVEHLQQLSRLASRCGAHVQHSHAWSEIHQKRRDHADDFLSADVANTGFRDEELLEGRKGRELANNVLGRSHPPGKFVGVPGHWLGRVDGAAILVFNLDDFGNVSGSQKPLDGERMAMRQSLALSARNQTDAIGRVGKNQHERAKHNVPLGAAEAEAVGQLALQCIPELRLFLLWKLQQRIVKLLELLILLLESRVVPPALAAITASSASTTASTTSFSLYMRNKSSVFYNCFQLNPLVPRRNSL